MNSKMILLAVCFGVAGLSAQRTRTNCGRRPLTMQQNHELCAARASRAEVLVRAAVAARLFFAMGVPPRNI